MTEPVTPDILMSGPRPRRTNRRLIAVALIFGALTLGACSSDGSASPLDNVTASGSAPDASPVGDEGGIAGDSGEQAGDSGAAAATIPEPVAEAPADTSLDETDSGTAQTGGVLVVAEAEDGGLGSEQWIGLIILGALVIGAIIAITAWISGRSKRSGNEMVERSRQVNEVISRSRWVHDQATMTVLATTDPTTLQSTWAAVQAQLIDLEASIAASRSGDPVLDSEMAQVGRSVGDLRGALAADVALRLTSQGQQLELVEASRRTVLQRNDDLERALRPLAAVQA